MPTSCHLQLFHSVYFSILGLPFWGKEKLPSITKPFLAGNGSDDGKKCGKACFSIFL